jgi:hypothetical protein
MQISSVVLMTMTAIATVALGVDWIATITSIVSMGLVLCAVSLDSSVPETKFRRICIAGVTVVFVFVMFLLHCVQAQEREFEALRALMEMELKAARSARSYQSLY